MGSPFARHRSTFPSPRVVRSEHEALTAVLVEEVLQVPRAVADVDLGVVEILRVERVTVGADSDTVSGLGGQLHQPDRAGGRLRVRVELRLLVHDGGDERGIKAVLTGVDANELRVAKRVADALVPGRARFFDDEDRAGRDGGRAR